MMYSYQPVSWKNLGSALCQKWQMSKVIHGLNATNVKAGTIVCVLVWLSQRGMNLCAVQLL